MLANGIVLQALLALLESPEPAVIHGAISIPKAHDVQEEIWVPL